MSERRPRRKKAPTGSSPTPPTPPPDFRAEGFTPNERPPWQRPGLIIPVAVIVLIVCIAAADGWSTCPVSESGFVRVSSNPKVISAAIGVADSRAVLAALRGHRAHRFLADDVSLTDADVPALVGHRQVTDAHLLVLARRHGTHLLTFDRGAAALAGGRDVELLSAL